MWIELILAVGIALFAFYKWATTNNDYFVKRGITFRKPPFLVGNFGLFIFKKVPQSTAIQEIYNWYSNEKMFGMFDWRRPLVVVRDPELIKQLTIKHFDHFEDHRSVVDTVPDDLLGTTLFMMKGQKWREMRGTLSPAFTGSKMRQMLDLVTECADEMTTHFLKKTADGEKVDLEMGNVFSRFTSDVIATCAFGLRVNSFEDPDNEISKMGQELLKGFDVKQTMRFFFIFFFPRLATKFNVCITSNEISKFFHSMVTDTMAERQKRGIVRHDMINILMQVRQGTLVDSTENEQNISAGFATAEESNIGKRVPDKPWSDNELVAQCLIFWLAGFGPVSTMLTFLTYELCINPDIQQKLYEEIVETNEDLDGKRITYDTMQKMKYLDQVVSESLRKWPTVGFVDRVCVKEYECEYDDGARFLFEKGVPLWVPIYGLHHDPNYFPDPEKFDPDRFSDENKRNIVPGTYLPFGIGPRNCIGSRFALMEMKTILYYTLLNFSLQPNGKSQIPIPLTSSPYVLSPDKGFHLDMIPRKTRKA